MSDLVDRLRVGICYQQCRVKDTASGCECAEAADRIAQLEAALRYALPIVEKYGWTQGDNPAFHAELTAPIRAALGDDRT